MKKHELLKYAYDNYPKGTKFTHPTSGYYLVSSGNLCVTSSDSFHISIYDKESTETIYNGANKKWGSIVTEEPKKPLLTSEDGFDLFEGDKYHAIYNIDGRWTYMSEYILYKHSSSITDKEKTKSFSTKQSAIDWIESQKPKFPKVNSELDPFGKMLHYEVEISDRGSILVGTKAITINGVVQVIQKQIIEDILKAMKELS